MGTVERDDWEDEQPAEPAADVPASSRRVFVCPECPEIFKTPEELGPHIERHYPLFDPAERVLTIPCPGGCGRFFPRKYKPFDTAERLTVRGHMKICDGLPPLVAAAPAPAPAAAPPGEVLERAHRFTGRSFRKRSARRRGSVRELKLGLVPR